jgi:hypothetical protein
MTIRNAIIFAASATTTSDWYALDYKYDVNPERGFAIELNDAADTMTIQVAEKAVSPDHIFTVSALTGATAIDGVLRANWPAVRFIYAGAGDSKIMFVG